MNEFFDFRASEICMSIRIVKGFPGGSAVKNLPANAGDGGSIPGSGRSPGEGNCSPLQCSCPGNPTDRGTCQNYSPWGHRRVRHDLATATAATRIEELCIHKFPSWVYIWGCVLYRILGTLNLYCFEISLPTIFHSGSVRRQWNGRKKNLLKF